MRRLNLPLALIAGLSGILAANTALAAADPGLLPKEGEVVKEAEAKGGWDPALSLGASLALSTNSNVVGQPDGSSWTFGLNILGRLDYLRDEHDWRNTLKIQEVFNRTPVIDDWVKTADQILFESVYYMRLTPQFGPFASFKFESTLFKGLDVRPGEVTYAGAVNVTDDRIKLTDSFQPMVLKEAIGAFYRPIETKAIDLDVRLGFGAHETFAKGALVIADDGATPEIELKELDDFVQAGAVLGVEAKGEFEGGRVSYGAHAEVMLPLINDDAEGRGVMDLANYDFGAKLTFKLFEWASLDYEFKAFLQPALVDEWQIQNNLLLTFSYVAID